MRRITEALDAWRAAVRELEGTAPRTALWFRARLIEEERRREYQARADEAAQPEAADLPTPRHE
jgi:small-conductance mechanosensitive channel